MLKVSRHQERIWALQVLYGLDITEVMDVPSARKFSRDLKIREELNDEVHYFEELVNGVILSKERYDTVINQKAISWEVERMAIIDRNILRLALFELENEVPTGVVINEAVELAKEYGDEKSSAFINGILAKV